MFTHQGILWIVLDEENVERIQQHDPFEFDAHKAGMLALRIPLKVVVAYARKEEHETIAAINDPNAVVKYLSRGFKVTESDHDRPYDRYDKLKR